MRLFIAFDVPTDVSSELARVQQELPRQGLSLSRDFHCTLKFLGQVDEKKVKEIGDRLSKVSFSAFETGLSGIGFFPLANSPRVVWVGLDPREQIIELQRKVDRALDGVFPMEERYTPHLTLGRVRDALDKKALEAFTKAEVNKIRFAVTSFALLESTLTPAGAVHKKLREFP